MNSNSVHPELRVLYTVGVNKPVSIFQTWNLKVCRLETTAVTSPHDMLTGVKIYISI